ncbi:GNAT family N-acetyltransferase [Saccharospirillum sp. HFRX-1]|uniref:GNAT family N-acetyltransferase n=1 Tax=unclassified Saccharospirillum TaxID=2633430 RepID=UPI00371416BF
MSSKDSQPVDVTITPATTADIPDLDAIADAAHQHQIYPLLSAAGVETLEQQRSRRWQRPLNDDGFGALKATLGDGTVGYIRWRDDYFVFALYVALDHQGQGIGRQLLDAMLAQCPATDIHLRSSINAVGFYQRYGFVAEGDEAVIDGIRFVPMVYRHR